MYTHNDLMWPDTACSDHKAVVCFPILWLSGLIFILIERQVTSGTVLKKILWLVCELSFRMASDMPAVSLAGDRKKGMLGKTERAFPFVFPVWDLIQSLCSLEHSSYWKKTWCFYWDERTVNINSSTLCALIRILGSGAGRCASLKWIIQKLQKKLPFFF